MRLKAVSGIALTVFLLGMLTLTFNVQPVKASETIYIRADGSIDPQTANITSADNVTYTFTDNNYESIIIERNNTVIDGAGYTLQGTGSGTGIDLSRRSNVTIKNMKIEGFGSRGIYLYRSSNNTISGNNITDNIQDGLSLWNSSYNNVTGNTVTSNGYTGISIYDHSGGNTIIGNTLTSNGRYSIALYTNSCGNTIIGNTLTSNVWGILASQSSGSNIIGNTLTSNGWGIVLWDHSGGNNISSNTLTSNGMGILASQYSSGNTISGNTVTSNYGYGILLANYSCGNNISGNTLTSNGIIGISAGFECQDNIIMGNRVWNNSLWGMSLRLSSGNTLRDNNVTGNKFNFGVLSDLNRVSDYVQDIDTSNTADGKPIYYWVNQRDKQMPADAGYVQAVNCVNITVEDLNLTKNCVGVRFVNTTDSTIRNVTALDNRFGINLVLSSGNTISGSTITSLGFYRSWDDEFSGPPGWMPALGITLTNSSGNTMSCNTITNNDVGVGLEDSSSNIIYHNNFINNTIQANVTTGYANTWDDDYPSGGNYWDNYNGTDFYNGAYQNITGSDGIGDTPYLIEEINQDNYPLMGPWTIEGENITVTPSAELTVTLENVTSAGITTVNKTETGPNPPSGFQLATETPIYYDIETTANYSGTIEICIAYNDTGLTEGKENALQLMQWDETSQQWIDITTYVDTENNVIYGEASHLSKFATMLPTVPVGGIVVPVDKFGLLAPYIALSSTIILATVAVAVFVKHRKKKQ